MQTTLTLTLVAACCVGTVLTSPSRAQDGRAWYAPPPGVYQAPGGGYPSLADFSRDVWGVPCGEQCTREAQARWSRYYYNNGRYPGRDPYGR